MPRIATRLQPIDRDIAVMIDDLLSPEAQSRMLAQFAREAIDEADAHNDSVVGADVQYETYVDGKRGAALESVKPDGVILAEWDLLDEVLVWISEQLVRRAPVRTGKFAASFMLFCDGAEVDIVNPPSVFEEAVFLSSVEYARKIERGQSPQAPDGVFEGVASVAQRRFGNTAKVSFGFRSPILPYVAGGANRAERAAIRNQPARQSAMRMERATRTPAIIVRPRG